MGAATSALPKCEAMLAQLSTTPIAYDDIFWRQLFLSSGVLLASLPPQEVDLALTPHYRLLREYRLHPLP